MSDGARVSGHLHSILQGLPLSLSVWVRQFVEPALFFVPRLGSAARISGQEAWQIADFWRVFWKTSQ